MRGIILSHTRMTGEGFCTSLAIEDDTVPRQIRPRLAPNTNTKITSFGLSEGQMMTEWRPGRVIEFEGFEAVQPPYFRPTHPEDVVFPKQRLRFFPPVEDGEFERWIARFTYPSLDELFPGLQTKWDGKAWVPAAPMPRSLGYVRCKHAEPYLDDKGKARIKIVSEDRTLYDLPLKDVHFGERLKEGLLELLQNAPIRFALAGSLCVPPTLEYRCYVMATHIVI